MQPDGSYEKQDLRGKSKLCAQEYFCREAEKRANKKKKTGEKKNTFTPVSQG